MKTYKEIFSITDLPDFQQNYLTEDMLLFDIETTGLSAARHQIYCIGCGYADSGKIIIELLFADNPDAELQILEEFCKLLNQHGTIITFNGTTFDIPFIKKRTELLLSECCRNSGLTDIFPVLPDGSFDTSHIFDKKESCDLYREVRSMKNLLELPSFKQKSVEQFLGFYREDQYNGGQLINYYHEYIKQPTQKILDLLLLHNLEDVKGMLNLIGILSYQQFIKGHFQIADIIPEMADNRQYLNIKLIPEYPLPQSIHRISDHASVLIGKESTLIRFPLHHGTLKHFFPDPENYYYLPAEDTVVHKSIGTYVDPAYRRKAVRKNCYIKKECDYIEIPVRSGQNQIQAEYNENNTYLEIPVRDKTTLKKFVQNFFQMYMK